MANTPISTEQLKDRLLSLHRSNLELVREMSLDSLMEKTVSFAMQLVNASYAALGLVDAEGKLERFLPAGFSPEELKENNSAVISHEKLTASMFQQKSIRKSKLDEQPHPADLPFQHPKITSVLGVPILQGQQQLGQIYLANKRAGTEFTADDQRIIEMLASFAAVSISNARFYSEMSLRDKALTRRNENLALLNQLASTLATSTDIDSILDSGLTQLMDYLRLEVGEIFMRMEDSKILQLLTHRGDCINTLWKRSMYPFGEGTVGRTAQNGNTVVLNLSEYEYADLNPDVRSQGLHQLAVVPMTGRRGVVGVLCVATCHPQPMDDLGVQFVQAISS